MSELTDSKMDFDTLVAADWLPSAKLSGELNADAPPRAREAQDLNQPQEMR